MACHVVSTRVFSGCPQHVMAVQYISRHVRSKRFRYVSRRFKAFSRPVKAFQGSARCFKTFHGVSRHFKRLQCV
eukprot:12254790-Alexandrium_andersonii.AAC.1